ncbi:hypothetical protein Tco_0269569 [Tanacetum coccineum]
MVNILVSGEAYDKVFNHLYAPLEGKETPGDLITGDCLSPKVKVFLIPVTVSVGSVVLRVILFGTILAEILIVSDIPRALELPAVSPFLCSDDSESDPESKQADKLPERHVSLRPFSVMVSKWMAKVMSRSSSPSRSSLIDATILSVEIPVALIPPTPSTEIATASPACNTLTPITTASSIICSRIRTTARKSTLGSSSSTSSSSLSNSASHTSKSSFTASLQGGRNAHTMLHLHLFDLLDPLRRGRYRGTSAAHSHESSDEGSLETHVESDKDSDIWANIEAETMAATVIVDGLGIKPVMVVVETGFEPRLAIVESKSKPEEVEVNNEADVEIKPEGTIKIRVDVTTRIDIPNDLLMIEDIEAGQADQQAKNLIVDGERSSLLKCVVTLEGSNTRLRYALGIERVRVDSLQQRLGYVEDELRRIRELRGHKS